MGRENVGSPSSLALDAGGPYSGVEGSPISLQGTVNDSEHDELTTAWSYVANSADPGTSCSFGDTSQLATTFTCTDDGTFTVSLEADDGLNAPVTATATVTIVNAAPDIGEAEAEMSRAQVNVTVDATDPGENDVLSYAFDCDQDEIYERDAGTTNSASCPLNPQQEGSFTFGVQVSDDDTGNATATVTVTIPTNLCASIHNGMLRAPAGGVCAGHEISYALPDDGPLNVCVSTLTQGMRTVDDLGQCASHEFGRVIAATEIETPPRRSR